MTDVDEPYRGEERRTATGRHERDQQIITLWKLVALGAAVVGGGLFTYREITAALPYAQKADMQDLTREVAGLKTQLAALNLKLDTSLTEVRGALRDESGRLAGLLAMHRHELERLRDAIAPLPRGPVPRRFVPRPPDPPTVPTAAAP